MLSCKNELFGCIIDLYKLDILIFMLKLQTKKHGGYRAGAGKPKGYRAPSTLKAMASREEFIKRVERDLEPIYNALYAKAVNESDIPAIKELLDRAWGKPAQAINMKVATFSLKELAEYRKNLIKEQHG